VSPEITESTRHIDTGTLFRSLNTPYIVFGVDDPDFTILEENQAHADVAMVDRDKVIGRPLLDVFPDTSEQYIETGVSQLLESIRTVIATGKPDLMPQLSYDLKDRTGTFKTKNWSVGHYPVFGKSGRVIAVYQETKDVTAELEVGRKLEKAQNQLDQVLANSMIGTYSWDIAGDKVYADANLAKLFGFPKSAAAEGLPLERFMEAIHPDDRAQVARDIDKTLKQKVPYESEYRTVLHKGQLRWVIARGHVETDDTGKPVTFAGVIVDLTDRKEAERALAESESRLRFMANAMPQLVWITRPDGYHEYYNQQWYDYTGTTPGETDGEGWSKLFHPADREKAWKSWRRSLKTGDSYEIEYRLYHAPTKTYRWVIGRARPFRNQKGEIEKWYGTCTDIDEQKRTAQVQTFLGNVSKELASSLNYTEMLKKITKVCVPSVADWCSVDLYDPEEGFTQVSVAHADAKKISLAKQYRDHNPITIDQPTGVPAVIKSGKSEYYPRITEQMIDAAVDDPKGLRFMKSLNLRSMIVAPIRIHEETVGGISFISSDSGRYYTESDLKMMEELAARISLAMTNSQLYDEAQRELMTRHKLEQELLLEKQKLESRVKERTHQLQLTNEGLHDEIIKRQAIEKQLQLNTENLARSNRELEDFAYVASHDLQEPLRKIQAFSNLLKSEYETKLGEGADYVNRMDAAAQRMSRLIQDLLTFSRVTTKTNPKVRIKLNQTVSDVLLDLETRIDEVGGTVKVESLPTVLADPTHMRQLFQNLISNALKFHQPDVAPFVTITARIVKNAHEIRVSDNGIGFDERYLDKIFSVFQRLHGRDSYEGTGIGLAVCRKIVERYGGTITAESEKNKGSTFIIRLPRIKERKKL
jgi:PAS domain S-box-containing protein